MARARNLKPSFFTNDVLAGIAPLGRLLFAGLWTIADREGRLEDRPKRIKAELLPYDDDADVDKLLNDLMQGGFVVRYVADGQKCIQIVSFLKHQDPHYKEKASVLPAPPNHVDSGKTAGAVDENTRQRVFDRDGRQCVLCGSGDDLSLDHVIPRAIGGTHDEGNLQTLCRRCNSGKNNRVPRPTVNQSSANDRPIIDQSSAYQPGNSPPLIPDSLNPLPPSLEEQRPRKRASRLKTGWVLPPEWAAWAMSERQWDSQDVARVGALFLDHWRGKGEARLDWEATWRNWVRRERDPPRAQRVNGAQSIHDRRAATAAAMYGGSDGNRQQGTAPSELDITGESERVS